MPSKNVLIRQDDQPWCNSFTKLLLRKKNRNYQLYKKLNSQYISALSQPNLSPDILTRLGNKKDKACKKSRDSANQSTKANRRAKLDFYNSVNSTMHNYSISAKKKFAILTNLMKNGKISSIPPLLDNDKVINDQQEKNNIFNDIFASKATVIGNNDPVPTLEPNDKIHSPLNFLNTSPIEVAQIIRNMKKSTSSYCGVPAKFLAIIATPISFPLYKTFHNCFAQS